MVLAGGVSANTKLREKLNNSIANDENYQIIYKLSIELDELIAKYYMEKIKK